MSWGHIILGFMGGRQKDCHEFETSLDYIICYYFEEEKGEEEEK